MQGRYVAGSKLQDYFITLVYNSGSGTRYLDNSDREERKDETL
jgi:hypothetical protein